jgi:AraC-like DNA-binding protein
MTAKSRAKAPTFAEQTHAIDDPTGPLGIRLVTEREGERTALRAANPTLIVPVHAGLAEIATGSTRHVVDRASWVLVPAGARASILGRSPVTHVVIFTVSAGLRDQVVRAYAGEIDPSHFERYLEDLRVLPRTNWVNEICHRYLFERAVCKKKDNDATRFLEMEIVKETYFLCHEQFTAKARSSLAVKPSALVERAMALVEEHLFEPEVVKIVAKQCGASSSTLLRTFKRELGYAPLAYVRRRRLDESILLLKSRKYRVGEVATLVGYKNFAAFSQAFRARFGVRPSEIR